MSKFPYLDDPLIKISKFLAIIKGLKTQIKFTFLNHALVLFISKNKMTRVACGLDLNHLVAYKFQSMFWDTNLKALFSYFGKMGVNYKHPNDFVKSFRSYGAVLIENFSQIANPWIYLGSLPNRSKIDLISFMKVEKAIESLPKKITSIFCTC